MHCICTTCVVSQLAAINSFTLICLLRDSQVRQLGRHDASRRGPRDDVVLAKVADAAVVAQKVLIKEQLAVDVLCRRLDNTQDSIREDGCFAKVFFFVWVCLCKLFCSC